jgi:hypothetical protein
MGGDIFPSGHTANAVVTWGILAYLASSPRARRWLSALSAITALGVGLTTVYLGTHWLSDVLLGWAAGLLILLAMPWFEPMIARAELAIFGVRDRWRTYRRAAERRGTAAKPAAAPADARPQSSRLSGGDEDQPRSQVGTTRTGRGPVGGTAGSGTCSPAAGGTGSLTQRTHPPARPDHAPITPSGRRRPPQSRQVAGG